jgi:hypothetical protein
MKFHRTRQAGRAENGDIESNRRTYFVEMTLLPTCIDIRDGVRTNAEISQQLMNRPTKDSEEAYELLYQKLRDFKVTHSNCNVPQGYPDKKLANFVGTIRILEKRRQLEPERVERLDSLGFSW